jgi:4-hydroxy-tetrahydrodipicolinate synthase
MMPLAELLFVEGNPVGIKRTLELTGAIGPGLRLPLVPASESLTERLRRQLARQGLIS